MNRYEITFDALRIKNEAAFIPFTVAGDPDLDKSEEIFDAYIKGGADILEIGYPFSDPVADGPVNQRASIRAIASGLNHASFFSLIKKIRAKTDIPFGLLMYMNSLYHIGIDEFCKKASKAGIDSILVADLPPEEAGELREAMHKYGLGCVYITTELTPDKRMKYICDQVDSFVYVVSRLGTTGVKSDLDQGVNETLRRLRKTTDKPLAVGFGISTPEHVRAVHKAGADGVIVGSALVNAIEVALEKKQNITEILRKMVVTYKAATIDK